MNKSYRIRTEVGTNADKHIKLKLDQEYDSFQILSLGIDQKDVYQSFNCDYGVIIGRVNANGGVGIPNAKLSVFIPITDEDSLRPEIKAIYPYESPRDKNTEGKRYNLLPRVGQTQLDGTVRPKQPFGSFPTKEEFVTNDAWLEVYENYYKFSTVTNESGDFMLFGVPVGTQTVHMSVDILDIGRFSMTPATMVTNLGYSPNLFSDNATKVKPSTDLEDLPNIETQEIAVDVIPFCGDSDNFDIGITRQDFRIRAELVSTFIVFGTGFTNGDEEAYIEEEGGASKRVRELFREHFNSTSIGTNRAAEVTEQIFYYPANVTDAEIADPAADPLEERMILMSDSEYSKFTNEGDFVYIIPCNRDKVVTDEFGNLVPVAADSPNGVFTTMKGFMTFEISPDTLPLDFFWELTSGSNRGIIPLRYRYKFPQYSTTLGDTLDNGDLDPTTIKWRKQHYTFESAKIYSVAKFYATVNNQDDSADNDAVNSINGFFNNSDAKDAVNRLFDYRYTPGAVRSADVGDLLNSEKQFPTNDIDNSQFGANWMNFAIYFVQNGRFRGQVDAFKGVMTNTHFLNSNEQRHPDEGQGNGFYFIDDNTQPIAGGVVNTKWFARIDLHFTDFIEVPKEDILAINDYNSKGFTKDELDLNNIDLIGDDYRNGESIVPVPTVLDQPQGSGRVHTNPSNPIDTDIYFYKGLNESDCIKFLSDLGLV